MKMNQLFASFISMLMIVTFPMNAVHASEASLADAMNELQYNLTVQWDQKDQAAKNQYVDAFTQKVAALKAAGLSDEELLKAVATEAGDPQSAADLQALSEYAKSNQLTPEQITDAVVQYSNQASHDGAHWLGKGGHGDGFPIGGVLIGVGVLAVIVVVIYIVQNQKKPTPAATPAPTPDCGTCCGSGGSSGGGDGHHHGGGDSSGGGSSGGGSDGGGDGHGGDGHHGHGHD